MKLNRQERSPIVRHALDHVVVRDAYPDDDDLALRRLAALDDRPALRGHVLLAEVDGDLVAAASVSDGRTIADPWRLTADVVSLLELRAAQIRRLGTGDGAARSRAVRRALLPVPARL